MSSACGTATADAPRGAVAKPTVTKTAIARLQNRRKSIA
jgi:hypothetical protein